MSFTACTWAICGHVSADNRKTQAQFLCVQCGYANNNEGCGGLADSNNPRLFFLASMLGAEVIELPPPAPLTVDDLVAWLKTCDDRGLYCHHPTKGELAHLKLCDGGLDLEIVEFNYTGLDRKVLSTHQISAENIDGAGRLTFDGRVILTRTTLS